MQKPQGNGCWLTVSNSQTYPARQVLCPAPGAAQLAMQYMPLKMFMHVPPTQVLVQLGLQYPPVKPVGLPFSTSGMQLSGSPLPVPLANRH
jgi:hypothetical protein